MATTRDLIGTYGQAGNTGTTDDINITIRKNSYCAGTRDDELQILPNNNFIYFNSEVIYQIAAPIDTIIDAVVEIPGKPPVKVTALSVFDPYSSFIGALISVISGDQPGAIRLRVVKFDNYPIVQEAPEVMVDYLFDPYGPGTELIPGIYVYINKNETVIGENVTGTITINNLVPGNGYNVNFRSAVDDSQILGINEFLDTPGFLATAETMVIPISIPNTLLQDLDTNIIVSIFSNFLPPPPDEA